MISYQSLLLSTIVLNNKKSYFVSSEMARGEIAGNYTIWIFKQRMDGTRFICPYFSKYVPSIRPLLDGHTSHYCPSMIR